MDSTREQKLEERFQLIIEGLEEIIGEEDLRTTLAETTKTNTPFRIYWGTSPTGKPHIGYLIPLVKIAQFLKAGCHVIILFADVHAYLDTATTSVKITAEIIEYRTQYYEHVIKSVLNAIGVNSEHLYFVRGSEFQLQPEYTMDMYRMLSRVRVAEAQKAGAEVVKQQENPCMASLLYPILQALDEHYLSVHAEFGGIDQRKIFTFSRDFMPKLGYGKRIHLMNPILPNLCQSGKMSSSSDITTKIDLLDDVETIISKIKRGYCPELVVENNPFLLFIQHVIFPILDMKGHTELVLDRDLKWGGPIVVPTYSQLIELYSRGHIHPIDIKQFIIGFLQDLLQPVRDLSSEQFFMELIRRAYPDDL
jgi:tyrosyl-tRNA synthetase